MRLTDFHSPTGIYLGKRYAFNLNQPVMNRFLERLARALLYHHNSIEYFQGTVEWTFAPDLHELSDDDKRYFASGISYAVGDKIFKYVGFYLPQNAKSLWLFRFYDGIEFMVGVKPSSRE